MNIATHIVNKSVRVSEIKPIKFLALGILQGAAHVS